MVGPTRSSKQASADSPSSPVVSGSRFETVTAVPGPIDGATGSPLASTASTHSSNSHAPSDSHPPSEPPMRRGTSASLGALGPVVSGEIVVDAAVMSAVVSTVVTVAAAVVVVTGNVVEVVDVSVGPGFDDCSVVHAAPTIATPSASARSRRRIIGWSP
jgi:hypothetical protein